MTLEEAKKWMDQSPFHAKCGIAVEEVEEGYCVLRAPVKEEDQNLWGIAHGGFIATLCDSASGLAIRTVHDEYCVTTSSTIHYLEPARDAHLRAKAKILKNGRTISVVEVMVFGEEKLLAEGSYEFFCAARKKE